ncbi:uncharacterized protein LOC127842395 [Dreissena polymorpha]|uniref:uncharacterized protein LOC127842395 n=1 Tax=Dreissena polymorpha TaxID=45954 RepID=UPI0022646ADB|nr:uncharacterized protein LOC127842395 [Dreissena polymorpha]
MIIHAGGGLRTSSSYKAMEALGLLTVLILLHAQRTYAQTGPPKCTYSDDVYICDYQSMASAERPIDYTSFSVLPQQIQLNVNGFLPYIGDGRVFSTGFETIDVTLLDINHPATLTVDCGWSNAIYIDRGAFTHMKYIERFKIRHCDIFYMGSDTVSSFEQLDSFVIEGGSVDILELDTFTDLSVEKLPQLSHKFPRSQGRVEFVNARFLAGSVPVGLLFFFKNLSSVALVGGHINSITADTFRYNYLLTSIDVSNNPMTSLPAAIFRGLNMLSEVTLYDIDWTCTCEDLTWLDDVIDTNVTLRGDLMCSNDPGTSVLSFYHSTCKVQSVCGSTIGFAIGKTCQTATGMAVFVLALVAFVSTMTSLAFSISTLRRLPSVQRDQEISYRRKLKKARENWRDAKRLVLKSLKNRLERRGFVPSVTPTKSFARF